MIKQINFEDNLYILITRIRIIRDIINLDVAPELFLEKTLDDICFIDYTLKILLEYLRENERLIEREELLEHFSELEWQFVQVLQDFLNHKGNISIQDIPSVKEKVTAFWKNSLDRQKFAESTHPAESNMGNETGVSSAELNELLKAF